MHEVKNLLHLQQIVQEHFIRRTAYENPSFLRNKWSRRHNASLNIWQKSQQRIQILNMPQTDAIPKLYLTQPSETTYLDINKWENIAKRFYWFLIDTNLENKCVYDSSLRALSITIMDVLVKRYFNFCVCDRLFGLLCWSYWSNKRIFSQKEKIVQNLNWLNAILLNQTINKLSQGCFYHLLSFNVFI
jgi:hypothetical protein